MNADVENDDLESEYAKLKGTIEAAGFFATIENDSLIDGRSHRVTCASLRRPHGGYTGNSFWVALRAGHWYLGTWGSWIYFIPKTACVADVCIAWMTLNPTKTVTDIPDSLKQQFRLMPKTEDEFDEFKRP